MSEPTQAASSLDVVVPGVYHFGVNDDRIGARSDAYAVDSPHGLILIDPLPLRDSAMAALSALPRVGAICLTIQSHQRSAWRYRKRFGVLVYAPAGAEGLEEEPDRWYGPAAALPGGLEAVHTPGPCEASYTFIWPSDRGVAFTGDLLTEGSGGTLGFVPDEYQDAPARTRASVRSLLGRTFDVICPGHAAPIRKDGHKAVESALAADARQPD